MNKLKLIAINLVVFIILWVIVEFVAGRIYSNLPEEFNNGINIIERNLGHKFDDTKQSIISHPYMLYSNNPGHIDSIVQNNTLGYRGEEFNPIKDKKTFRILTLGGSTTYGYLNKNPKTTWSALLEKKLNAHIKNLNTDSINTYSKVEVINAGLNYGTSAELLAGYMFRHRYLAPDLVIFHEGGNDVSPTVYPDYSPEYTHLRASGNTIKLRSGEKILIKSNFFKLLYCLWLNNTSTVYTPYPYSFFKLDANEVKQRVHNDSNYIGFERNVDLLVKNVISDSSEIVLMGFLNSSNKKIGETRPNFKHIVKEMVFATNKNNSIMSKIAEKYKIDYINLDKNNFPDDLFIDNCHLIEKGEDLKAQAVFEVIKSKIK